MCVCFAGSTRALVLRLHSVVHGAPHGSPVSCFFLVLATMERLHPFVTTCAALHIDCLARGASLQE